MNIKYILNTTKAIALLFDAIAFKNVYIINIGVLSLLRCFDKLNMTAVFIQTLIVILSEGEESL